VTSPDNLTESTTTKEKKSKKSKKNKKILEGNKTKENVDEDGTDFEITDNVLLPKVKNK